MGDDDAGALISPVQSLTLDLPPSCVEFSRISPDHFVIGTYNLERQETESEETTKVKQSRNGSLLLFRTDGESCALVQTLSYPSAILDLHFSSHSPDVFAIASSTGAVSFFELQQSPVSIKHLSTQQIVGEDVLVLSFAWHPTLPTVLGATFSNSSVGLFQLDKYALSPLAEDINIHSGLEAWTLAFSVTNTDVPKYAVYSGGDDSRVRCSVISADTEFDSADLSGPRSWPGHDAGVVAILPLPLHTPAGQDILLTGSYDDHVRVYAAWDHRADAPNARPKALAESYIGGGVWRLKFLRQYRPAADGADVRFQVLASCMHAGARVLEVRGSKGGEWEIEVLGRVAVHQSMNYGSDVQPAEEVPCDGTHDSESALCVSTSFYDRLLCLWKFEGR